MVMIMSRYSSVNDAFGSITVAILSVSIRKPWSSTNSVCAGGSGRWERGT